MEQKTFKQIKKLCEPLIKLEPIVKAIFIYGSSIKKKKANDIDILVIIDNTQKLTKTNIQQINKAITTIENKKPGTLPLHFQPPMFLTRWWSLIIKGEPWILTALKNPLIIFDDSEYVTLMQKMIKSKNIYGKDIKAERLAGRSREFLTDNRSLMLTTVEELFLAANEAAQLYLLAKNKILFKPENILKELEKDQEADTFKQILDLHTKTNRGTLSEFTGENLDYYENKIKAFISKMEKATVKTLGEKIKK